MTIICEGQKAYGKQIDLKAIYRYYQAKLERRFSVEQVIHAIDVYTDKRNDIPTPADVIGILNPDKPLITEAQYVQACKAQERNGYPQFSPEAMLIREYRQQNDQKETDYKLESDRIASLASNSIKRITE